MLEMNVTIAFPAAPLLTVILALVGMYDLTFSTLWENSADAKLLFFLPHFEG